MCFPLKPENLATGLILPKLCPELGIFFEGHSASRCSITSKTFFINHYQGSPVSIFRGGAELGWYGAAQTD